MDTVSFLVIVGLLFILGIVLALPILVGLPFYSLLWAKFNGSTLLFTLLPNKRLTLWTAKVMSSVLQSGNKYFLNMPDAIYSFYGMPAAIAYYKYGAILPPQNIIYSTKMRELGFKNQKEVELHVTKLNDLKKSLLEQLEGVRKQISSLKRVLSDDVLFTLENSELLEREHFPSELRDLFKKHVGVKLPKNVKYTVEPVEEGVWRLDAGDHGAYVFKATEEGRVSVYRDLSDKGGERTKLAELEAQQQELEGQLAQVEEHMTLLQNLPIEETGILRIQDIFNFLSRHLSTDVIFSLIERIVAVELRNRRDYLATFTQMMPYIITLLIGGAVAYTIVVQNSGGGGLISSIHMPQILPSP
jgi:small nuclear ribonucleoprotein (snRNP)-like protein